MWVGFLLLLFFLNPVLKRGSFSIAAEATCLIVVKFVTDFSWCFLFFLVLKCAAEATCLIVSNLSQFFLLMFSFFLVMKCGSYVSLLHRPPVWLVKFVTVLFWCFLVFRFEMRQPCSATAQATCLTVAAWRCAPPAWLLVMVPFTTRRAWRRSSHIALGSRW